jgi:hypothetical protein
MSLCDERGLCVASDHTTTHAHIHVVGGHRKQWQPGELCFEGRHTGPVFSTMNAVIAPCLSALLLPSLLLLLFDSSTYEQVCAVCTLSGAATLARSRCDAVAKGSKTLLSPLCWRRASNPSLVASAGRCCGSCSNAVCGDTCERSLAADVGCAFSCACHAVLLWTRRLRACDMRRLYDRVY